MERSVEALLVAVVCGVTTPYAGGAQERVRVTLDNSDLVVIGMVERIAPEAIALSLPGGVSRVVALADVSRIEMRTMRRQWKQGLIIGWTAGGVLGAVIGGPTTGIDPEPRPSIVEEVVGRAFWGLSFGAPFGGVGAAVGGLIKREGWETVRDWRSRPMTPGLLVGTHAMANGDSSVLLGARVRF